MEEYRVKGPSVKAQILAHRLDENAKTVDENAGAGRH